MLASVPSKESDACLALRSILETGGLKIIARVCGGEPPAETASTFTLDLVGNDRPGIVHDITTVLASHQVSVLDLDTVVESASMAGGELFKASAQLLVPESTDVEALENELHDLANDLMVDIRFEK